MFEKTKEKLWEVARAIAVTARESMKSERERLHVNPEQFNNHLALKVSWNPNIKGGANFRTARLKMDSDGKVKIAGTGGMILFGLVFIGFGLLAILMIVPIIESTPGVFKVVSLMPLTIGSLFLFVGFLIAENGCRNVCIDQRGVYRRGSLIGSLFPHASLQELRVSIDEIGGIQIVGERIIDSDGPDYYSFEMNLVKKDCDRITIEDHTNINSIREDGEKLARYLSLPLWDGTVGKF